MTSSVGVFMCWHWVMGLSQYYLTKCKANILAVLIVHPESRWVAG